MEPFKTERGVIAPVDRANIDTDQLIAKQYLKSIKRTGFGEFLFDDWRQLPDGRPNPEFELNQARYKGARFLVARNNFGCGSSREHAVWAVVQAGFRAVIAPRKGVGVDAIPAFADIFAGNSVKNGLLTIELSEAEVDRIFAAIKAHEGLEATVDLPAQRVVLHTQPEQAFPFEINAGVKNHLLKGLDDIGLTLEFEPSISAFERTHDTQMAKA